MSISCPVVVPLAFDLISRLISTRTELMRHFDLVDFESGRGEKRRQHYDEEKELEGAHRCWFYSP
jgi:hypothetical protein